MYIATRRARLEAREAGFLVLYMLIISMLIVMWNLLDTFFFCPFSLIPFSFSDQRFLSFSTWFDKSLESGTDDMA